MPVFNLIFVQSSRFVFAQAWKDWRFSVWRLSDCVWLVSWRGNYLIIPGWFCCNNPSQWVLSSSRGHRVGQNVYLVPNYSIIVLQLTYDTVEYSLDISAKWHCIKWDKHFWSMKYFCLPRFDTITLICYSCQDCSSEMIDINWIHIKRGFCAEYSTRTDQILPWCIVFSTPGAGVGVYVTVNLLSEVRRGASRFHANYTRSQAKWHHFNTW